MESINPVSSYYKVLYNGKNITANLSLNLIDISYTDNVSGVADDLEIRLEDTDGKWQNEWYPTKGAILSLEMGYPDGRVLKPNDFEIDEIELDGSKQGGDVVTIKAISGGVNKALHTKRSHAHENKTLGEIVRTVAARYNLQVIGNIENILIGRSTQHHEKDLTFLARLADEYGYVFSVKGSKLNFVKSKELEGRAKVTTIDKTDCIGWNVRDKSSQVYEQAHVASHNPNSSKVVQSTNTVYEQANNDGVVFSYLKPAANSLEVRGKTENEAQANVKAEAALHFVNSLQQTAEITLPGNVKLLAGNNIELTGFGVLSGIWNILKSTHKATKTSNYITTAELKRVVPATQSNSVKKPKAAKPSPTKVEIKHNLDGFMYSQIVPAARDNTKVK